jgi:hypothetical protein
MRLTMAGIEIASEGDRKCPLLQYDQRQQEKQFFNLTFHSKIPALRSEPKQRSSKQLAVH